MLEIYFKSIRDDEFKEIEDFKVGSWIHITDATMEDLTILSEKAEIEIDDILDSMDKYEIPRIEHSNSNIVVYSRHSAELEEGLHTTTLTIVLTNNFVVTISPQKSKIIDNILISKSNLATTQKSKLLLYILLKITQDFTSK